jgi:hypothetical protein
MDRLIVTNTRFIEITTIRDGFDGIISVADEMKNIPFAIKRVYYIYNLINHEMVMRGKHAHKSLEQVLFCVNGGCSVLLDDGVNKQEIDLTRPDVGVYVGPGVWHIMRHFINNPILVVVASDYFNEADYIRNYNDFLTFQCEKQPTLT